MNIIDLFIDPLNIMSGGVDLFLGLLLRLFDLINNVI